MDNLDLELERVIAPKGAKDHSQLQNLDYENSGHRGFASIEQLNATNEKVSTLEEQVQTNASAIQALSEGIDPEKIDGIKDLIDYVEEHEVDVVSIQEGIEQNANDIDTLEEKVTALEESGEPIVAMLGINSENTSITIKNISNAVLIDWGDGTPIEDISSKTEYTHTYTSIAVVYVKIYGGNGQMDIGNSAFYNLSTLYRIIIPQFTSISGEYAFYGCGLAEISLPSVLTMIGRSCFAQCTRLTYIKIPKNVSTIRALAFSGCSSLKLVEIENTQPSSVSSNSFPSTTKFIVPYEALEQYKSNASWSTYASQIDAYALVSELPEGGSATPSGEPLVATFNIASANTSVTVQNLTGATMVDWGDGSPIEDISSVTSYSHTYNTITTRTATFYGVKYIGNYAFWNQPLIRIALPNSITSISSNAFSGTQITNISIPNLTTAIMNNAFYNCASLVSVIVGASVSYLATSVFALCNELEIVQFLGSPPEIAGSAIFPTTTKIIVPYNHLEAYKTTSGWTAYASQIDAYAMASDIGNINTQLANIIEGEGV